MPSGRGCVGVYLDDMFCGTEIVGNVFYRVRSAAFVGGGRDCTVENNVFVDCSPALHVDARGLGWAKYPADEWVKEANEKGTLAGIRFREPPYSERYPKLVSILADSPAFKLGFKRLPMEKIGLYRDRYRASWPVKHGVRHPKRDAAGTPAQPKR